MKTLSDITLISGKGDPASRELCLMSAVAYLAGEEHSDHPVCACPVLTAVGIRINDGPWWQDDQERTVALAPLAEKLIGSRSSSEIERKRADLFLRAAITEFTPDAFEFAAKALNEIDLKEHASTLLGFAARLRKGASQEELSAASSAAESAAESAAWSAAESAAESAAWSAAESAAYAASSAAYAARSAAWSAASSAAYAASSAAYAASSAAWRAASSAARSDKKRIRDRLISLLSECLGLGLGSGSGSDGI